MRLAVVLFNLGAPDQPASVRPFLRNLFSDPAIIDLPGLLRLPLAALIAARRTNAAQKIYAKMGGGSPLLRETEAQARALEGVLGQRAKNDGPDSAVKVFIAMRYWRPLTEETVAEVGAWGPDRIVLLPLYPQFSTTTTASSLGAWRRAAVEQGLSVPDHAICCYPTEAGLIEAHAARIRPCLIAAASQGRPRLLFSAHGLPMRIVERGDPYPFQVEQTARAVVAALQRESLTSLDWTVCYQSKVGPLEWIGPSTISEIERAGGDGVPVVIAPIAFVSEHSETLVELDIDYRELARDAGVPGFFRAPALGIHPDFIGGLAGMVAGTMEKYGDVPPNSITPITIASAAGRRMCPLQSSGCPLTH
jgi:ferrochelatase